MKYMLMFTSDGDGMDAAPPEAVQAIYAKVGEWWTAHSASGALVDGHQLQPASTATTVDPRTGVVTDGPFLEAKESIGGYGIVEAPDLDTVIAMAKTWPASPHVEIRPIVDQPGM
jgi:hypothetical protein